MIREMEKNYPELKKILDDPYGSVYLHEGMYEEAIRFLEDRMSQHGGEVDLIAMYDENDMEGAYLKAALGRLMVTCDFKDIAKYESSVRRMEVIHGKVNPELNPLMLNQDLLELIKLDSREANERIGKKGFYRWQEENKRLGSILEEGVNNFAYGLMMYHTARVEMDALSKSAQQRDVKMPRKVTQKGKGLKAPDKVSIDSKQLGKKWGKHKIDYPDMKSYTDYENYVNEVFSKPDIVVYDSTNKEYLYLKGNDLLRVGESGEFISLYPGIESRRVIDAIINGGIIWP